MHLGRIGEAVVRLVQDQRVVFPGVPVPEHHLHEFVRPVVAGVVPHMLVAAEIGRFRAVERGHDVPRSTALQHQIHRREQAGDVERLVIGGGVGHSEPEPLRHHPHRHQDGRGVHLDRAHPRGDRLGMMAGVEVGKRQAVIKKRHLDLAVLQGAGDALVVFRRQEIEHRRWMAPRSRQVRAVLRLQKGDQRHHAVLERHRRSL